MIAAVEGWCLGAGLELASIRDVVAAGRGAERDLDLRRFVTEDRTEGIAAFGERPRRGSGIGGEPARWHFDRARSHGPAGAVGRATRPAMGGITTLRIS
jgi:enoyl-CoA hydratase/carnithine racemase